MAGRLMLPAILALFMVTNAAAQNVKVYTFEDSSCGKWSSLGRDASRARDSVATWTLGFISRYNWFNVSNRVTRDLSNETITAYVDKYCRDNPAESHPAGGNATDLRDAPRSREAVSVLPSKEVSPRHSPLSHPDVEGKR
jgi:hypothetical protein